jgi:DNA modification methylase
MSKKISEQLSLPLQDQYQIYRLGGTYFEHLDQLLGDDLDFHKMDSGYAAHKLHAFPAKFPPQLPLKFIQGLTKPGDLVLDPMAGSGTTILEAYLNGRRSFSTDIDPLAILISKGKVTPQNSEKIEKALSMILRNARNRLNHQQHELDMQLTSRWDDETKQFVEYWFAPETRYELMALVLEIEEVEDRVVQLFMMIAFSAVIITKSGGVSLALDLAHTRPHRAKIVINQSGEVLEKVGELPDHKAKYLTKILRSPLDEFEKRVKNNLRDFYQPGIPTFEPWIMAGDAQHLPLRDETVDLIVTSPPYASNAIDYMRAHKFSLVWMDFALGELSIKRKNYIGGELVDKEKLENLPEKVIAVMNEIGQIDQKKGLVLHRYYSEMSRSLCEMYRVLKPGKAAVVVVGSSIMRSTDTLTHICLAEIGRNIGFVVPRIGVRSLDRDRRMLPAGNKINLGSQIQQRMHFEYVIGFYKT